MFFRGLKLHVFPTYALKNGRREYFVWPKYRIRLENAIVTSFVFSYYLFPLFTLISMKFCVYMASRVKVIFEYLVQNFWSRHCH